MVATPLDTAEHDLVVAALAWELARRGGLPMTCIRAETALSTSVVQYVQRLDTTLSPLAHEVLTAQWS